MNTLKKRKYKIFDYCWHIPHQYDMINCLKEDCQFYFCLNSKKQWDNDLRPMPNQLKFVTNYEAGIYDLAILHIDQQVITVSNKKRRIFDELNGLINDIPKIIINHGSPVFPEAFIDHYDLKNQQLLSQDLLFINGSASEKDMEEKCKEIIRSLIGDNPMVVNSYKAASKEEWGFGIPIVHGINSSEWSNLPKEPRVFTAISPYGFDTYYNRLCLINVNDILYDKYGYLLACAKLNVNTDASLEAYKTYLGRSLIYLDTSFRTPMNRARTEAFLSGCCVVQVEGAHDLDRWARHGENIIIVPNDAEKIAAVIVDLLENKYEEAIQIGENGRKMAIEKFHPDRYRNDWLALIKKTLVK